MGIVLSISCVHASDLENDTIQINGEDTVYESGDGAIYVSNDLGSDRNDGQSWQTSVRTINSALHMVKKDSVIYLDNGTYSGGFNTKLTIGKSISFIGGEDTVIDGNNENSIFTIDNGVSVVFKNLKFVNASKSKSGGESFGSALEINNATVTIDNCQFINNGIKYVDNDMIYGGAISNFGNLTVLNSYFYQNSLENNGFGGAIYNNGQLFVENSSFIKSYSGKYSKGASIYNEGVTFVNNSIIANSYVLEESMGGAIFNNGNFTLKNSIIENNTVERNNFNFIYGNVFNSGLLVAYGNIFRNNTGYYKQPNSGYEGCPTIYNTGDLNLTSNAFINNIGGFEKIYTDVYLNGGKSVHVDNNWWGDNDNPFINKKINVDKVTSWVILDVTPEYSAVNINETVDIIAFWKLNTGGDSEFLIPIDVVFSTNLNQTQKSTIKNGKSIFKFNNTQNKGLYELIIGVNSLNKTVLIDVGKNVSYIKFNVSDNIYSNQNLFINVGLYDENSNFINGTLLISVNDQIKTLNVVNGIGRISFSNIVPGNHVLSIVYDGNDNYFKAFNQTPIKIKKYQIDLTIHDVGDVKVDEAFNMIADLQNVAFEGQANIYVNGVFKQVVYLKYGENSINFVNFKDGLFNVTFEVLGNDYFESTNVSAVFKVTKYNSLFEISSNNISMGEDAILQIHSFKTFRGDAILSINGVNYTIYIKDKYTNITLSNLSAGEYDVELMFEGNDLFDSYSTFTSFSVLKLPSNLTVDIINNTISVNVDLNCTGFVHLYVNNNYYKEMLSNGSVTFDVDFEDGSNYVFVFYEGDEFHSQSNWTTVIGEGKAYAIVGDNMTAWEYNNFTYSVFLYESNGIAMPNKVISITINSKTYNITTDSYGKANLPLNLAKGNYTIISTYQNLTDVSNILVKQISFNLNSTSGVYGENVVIEAEFDKNITGKVNFTLSNKLSNIIDIDNGKAVFVIQNLPCGHYEVESFYLNDLFSSDSVKSSFDVNKFNSNFEVDVSEAFVGDDVIITLKGDDLTGEVRLIVDGDEYFVNLSSSQATLTLLNLSGGSHSLTINYFGDKYHKNTTLTKEFNVKTLKTVINLNINDTAYGEKVKAVAILNDNATGFVSFSVNGLIEEVEVKNGIAIWSFGGLNAGTYKLTAKYLGDNNFLSASNSTDFKITKAKAAIVLYTNGVYLDENIEIHAKLSSNATGKVSFRMEDYYSPRDKEVVNASSIWVISPLKTGRYTVFATYKGDSNYYSSSTKFILNVAQTRSHLTVEVNDASSNDRVIVRVTLISGDELISGVVNVNMGGKTYKINVKNGKGSLVLGKIKPGNYALEASFDGDELYSNSSSTTIFTVYDSLIESFLTCDNLTKYYNNDAKLIISLTNPKNKPISNEILLVKVNGVESKHITDGEGKIYLDTDYPSGKYLINVVYEGSDSYHASSLNSTLDVLSTIDTSDLVKLYGSGTQYFSVFRDSNGKALSNTVVFFKFQGKTYNYTTFPNGIVRLNINLNPGKYKIVAINPVTGERSTNTLTIYSKLMANKDVVNYFGATTVYKVRAYGNDGKHVGKGFIVTFKVNGKKYNVKTDKNGYATLKVKLNVKSYVVTAEFNGTKVSNKITVKPVLTMKITANKKSKKIKFTAKLVNSKGKVLKGKKITFKIKGKKYVAKTNKKGIASVSIALKFKKGSYKVYASYGKSKLTNIIRIK